MSSTETESTEKTETTEPQNDSKQFTQEQLDAIVTREKQKAQKTATSSFVSELGFNDPDELKNVVAAFKDYQDKSKSAEQRLAELEQQSKTLNEKASKYEETITGLLESAVAEVPEERRSLIPDELADPVAKLNWITRNRQFLTGKQPVTVGATTTPAAATPTAPVSYEDFKKLKAAELMTFHKDFPEIAQDYSQRFRQGL